MKYKFIVVTESLEERDQLIRLLEENKAKHIDPGQRQIDDETAGTSAGTLVCMDCGKSIPKVVADYSFKWYGKHLCRDCQPKYQQKEEEG